MPMAIFVFVNHVICLSVYLPWSNELPEEIRNYNEDYEDLKVEDERPSKLIV